MAGQIIARGKGKWMVRAFLGRDPQTKKRLFQNKMVHGSKRDAEKVLAEMLRERDLGGVLVVEKVAIGTLLDDLVEDYRINGKRVDWCELVVRTHLRPFFGNVLASKLTTDLARKYISARQTKGIANSTVNRELSLLRRSLNLGRMSTPPKVARVPFIPKLEENNVRKGFFEDAQYRALLRELPTELKPILTFAYYTGCRRGEILKLQWSQVDLVHRLVRLEPGTTKNDEARVIPLVSDLLTILQDQKRLRDSRYPQCEWVFFREGERILSFKAAWAAACVRAGLVDAGGEPTKLFHDLRRTGVRNLVRAGVPEAVAMRISGHKTRAVFDRYNIVSESDLTDAAEKLDQHIRRRRTQDEKSEGGDDES
ncbi:MAG: site-specific integrase [Bryobacteraceae bacterium]